MVYDVRMRSVDVDVSWLVNLTPKIGAVQTRCRPGGTDVHN